MVRSALFLLAGRLRDQLAPEQDRRGVPACVPATARTELTTQARELARIYAGRLLGREVSR